MEDVTWKPIPRYEGYYEASDAGEIRRSDGYIVKARTQAPGKTNTGGYLIVDLTKDGNRKTRKVHQLVATAFLGPIPPGKEVCHNNGRKTDNYPDNLRYDTRSQNILDQVEHGTHNEASRTHCHNGHPLEGENLSVNKRGIRTCVTCRRDYRRRWAADNRDHVRARSRDYYARNRERILAYPRARVTKCVAV